MIVHAKAFMPSVSENMSIVAPSRKPSVITQLGLSVIGSLIMKYMNRNGNATLYRHT